MMEPTCTTFFSNIEPLDRCITSVGCINHYYCSRHIGQRSTMCCACRCIKNGWDLSYSFLKKQWREDYFSGICKAPLKQAPPLTCCERSPTLLHRMCSKHESQILSGLRKQCCWCSKYGEFCDPYELMANQTWTSCRGRMFQIPRRPECNGDKLHVVCSLHQKHRMCCMCAKDDRYSLKMVEKQGPYNWADPYKKVKCGQPKYISHDMIRRECCSGPLHRICDKHWNNTICCECIANINKSEPGMCCDEHLVTRLERRLQVFRHPFYSPTRTVDVDDEPDTKEEEMISRKPWGECFDAPCLWTEKHLTMPMYYCHHPKGSKRLHYYCDMHYDQRPRRQACCACWDDRSNVKREAAVSEWYRVNLRLVQKQGQVQSNQTGNSPNITPVTATGGSNVTTINYYGAQYAQAYNPSNQAMDPSQFTEPLNGLTSAATGIPMLQNPSAEECGYSDRIMQLTSGNSTIITQEAAAGAVIGYGTWPGQRDDSGSAIDLPTRPGPSCDRWYTLPSFGWTTTGIGTNPTNGHLLKIPLPGILLDQGVFGQNALFHYLWRGGFAAHIQCNATRFHQGCLMCAMIPEFETSGVTRSNFHDYQWFTSNPGTTDSPFVPQQAFLYPHQMINLRTNNSATIVVPYVNTCPQSSPIVHSPWSLVIFILVPLSYGSGATTEVPITVSICPIESEFGGLRSATVLQGVPVFQIPGSRQFITTLRNDGFPALPNYEKTHSFPLPGRVRNLLEVCQVPTLMNSRMGVDDNWERPWQIQINNETVNYGDLIQVMDMSLMADLFEPTYVGQLARMYAQYRGDLILSFMFCGSAMTTGKLLVAYTPPGTNQPTTRSEAMLGTHVVWDLGLQSSLTFAVPFISTVQSRYTSAENSTLSYCGYISIFMQTKLVHPTGTPTTSVVLAFASASDNFTFKLPVDTAYFQGLGDAITSQVNGLMNTIGGQLQLPVNNPGVPMVTPPTGSQTNQLSIDQGGSGNLSALETGVSQTAAAEVQMATRPCTARFSAEDTEIEFVMSRYSSLGTVTLETPDAPFKTFQLSFTSLKTASNLVRTKFQMFTYVRFDVDLVLVPIGNVTKYQVMYCPFGSVVPTSGNANWNTSSNAVITQDGGENVCFRVPYTSPGNFFCTAYDGFNTFDLSDTYGTPPGDVLGTLAIRSLAANQLGTFFVYARPVNIEVFCPRPIKTFNTRQTTLNTTRFRIVAVADGTPNSEPRANVQRQGVTFQGLSDWLSGLVKAGGEQFSAGFTGGVLSAVDDYVASNMTLTPGVVDWVKTVMKWLTKIIASLVIIVRSNADAAVVAAVGVSLGIDLLTTDPFDWLRTVVLNVLGWKKKQGPSDWLKEFNAAVNAMKGFDWIATQIKKFLDWLKGVEDEKKEEIKKYEQACIDLPGLMSEWDAYEKNRSKYTEASIMKLAERILGLRQIFIECGKSDTRMYLVLQKYASKALKYVTNHKKRLFEPVGLLVHGKPGCGKSLLTSILGRQICKMMKCAEPYSLPPDPDHFDGYEGQEVVIMDDLGQNPDGKDCSLLCQMISTTEFVPPMADLEDKGVPFTSKFVLASTNLDRLTPLTVSDPRAIERRFAIDLEMTVSDDYKTPAGHLDVAKAMEPCQEHESMHFKFCTPFICGKACKIYNRRTKKFVTPDLLIAALTGERRRKMQTIGNVDALFQGPKKNGCVVEFTPTLQIVDEREDVPYKILPAELADLIRSVDDERIVSWCEEQGYIIEADLDKIIVERETRKLKRALKATLIGLGLIGLVGGMIYTAWRLWPTEQQGAYSGNQKATLKKPELRVVQVQGPVPSPDMQYIQSLMNSNLIPIQTGSGPYTAVGIYERWLILPKHAAIGPYFIGGKEVNYDDAVELTAGGCNLELACLHFPTINEVKDIRKHLPDNLHGEDNCYLALNSSVFPRMVVPVGRTSVFGIVNLEMTLTKNTLTYAYPTKMGQCGGLICKAGQVLGIHIGGDGSNGYAAALRKSYFVKLEGKKLPERPARASVNVRSSSSLQPSVWHDILPGEKEPAVLSKFDKRCKVDFEKALFDKYQGNEKIASKDQMTISLAAKHYVEQIRPLMPPDLTTPLSLEEVVYGAPGLEALDLNTSAGFPYCTRGISKKSLIPPRGEPLTRLQEALDLHGYKLPFVTFLKDELRPKEKVEQGKTRLIEASSLNDTVFMKQHLGKLFQVFNTNPGTVLGSAVGCNPDIHWSKFVVELGHENICAFDYKNFDASLNPCWFIGLKEVLCGLGFEEDLINGIVNHICYSTHIYRNVEYDVEGGMPSGTSGTSIFNSIINNLIVRTLVLDTYKGIDLDQLKILAYGDDLLVSYPFPLDPGALAETGKKYGLKMTPADKSETFDGVKNIWEVTFLKRRFVPDTQFPFLIHPVYPMDQIYESLRWTRKPSETNQHVRSLCELAWHNGREDYEKFTQVVRSVPIGRAFTIPAFDVLLQKWYDQF
nr:polyprotein [Mute swan feces associated sapelovirus 1]